MSETEMIQPMNKSEKKVYSAKEIMDTLQICRTTAYDLIQLNLFHSVRIGTHIRISKESFDEWLSIQI